MSTAAAEPFRRARGTSNTNDRGSSRDRARRRSWLLETFGDGTTAPCFVETCDAVLTDATITVDRIVPGIEGGTYRRGNIRPACSRHNSSLGGILGAARKAARKLRAA